MDSPLGLACVVGFGFWPWVPPVGLACFLIVWLQGALGRRLLPFLVSALLFLGGVFVLPPPFLRLSSLGRFTLSSQVGWLKPACGRLIRGFSLSFLLRPFRPQREGRCPESPKTGAPALAPPPLREY